MPFVPSPGVALLAISGTQSPNRWAIVLHWYTGSGAPWTQSQINALATSAQSGWTTSMVNLFPATVIVTDIKTADLSDTGNRYADVPNQNIVGTRAGTTVPQGSSVLVNYQINSRYRGGHGRTYLPPATSGDMTLGDTWTAAYVTNVTSSFGAFLNKLKTDMTSAGLSQNTQCVPRYSYTYSDVPAKHKWTKQKTGFIAAYAVNSFTVSTQVRSQRRRLGK